MRKVERDLIKVITKAVEKEGCTLQDHQLRGSGHFRWTVSNGEETIFFATGGTPRCTEVLIRRATSKARRVCRELNAK